MISADGFKQLDNGGDTGFDKSDVMVKFDYQWNTAVIDHVVALKMSYADEFSNETYLGLSDEDFATTPTAGIAPHNKTAWTGSIIKSN